MKFTNFIIAIISINAAVFAESMEGVEFPDIYYFHPGDSAVYSDTSFDHSSWFSFGQKEFPYDRWEGIGWFRFDLAIDTSLCEIPLGLTVQQIGAVEIFIDGKLIYSYGKVGRNIDEEQAYLTDWYPKPRPIFFQRKAHDKLGKVHYVCAVRYSSFLLESTFTWGARPTLNFEINDRSEIALERSQVRRKAFGHQMFLFGILFTFGLIHLLFFLYYKKIRANLYFAAIAFSAAILSYLRFESYFIDDPQTYLWSLRLFFTLAFLLSLSTLQFIYSLLYIKFPRRWLLFPAAGLIIIVLLWIWPLKLWSFMFFFFVITGIEQLRLIISMWFGRRNVLLEGSKIILFGIVPFIIVILYQAMVSFDIVPELWTFIDFPMAFYAILILALSMSLFLSRNFAHTNSELERRLIEVQDLSEKTLKQELQRIELEKENERKSIELNEARALQISMLPKSLPNLENCDISVFMQTATEVGGDYYDFRMEGNDAVTIALGDATGHGMKSGTVVSAAKALFKAWSHLPETNDILQKMSESLKKMGFSRMYMAMIVAKLSGDKLSISTAGMPNPLIWRKSTGEIEEINLQGMPLGTFSGFDYQLESFHLMKDDTVILMSDGLPELSNPSGEQIGHDRVLSLFRENADKSAQEIVDILLEKAREWCSCDAPDDDLTLLTIKVK
jgi:serine phosphatase RsbU (regulator of sigma subunit)